VSARTPEEIRASVIEARHDLAGSVADLRQKVGVLTDWRRQLNEHRDLAIGAAVVVGFIVGWRVLGRRR
jgi:transposase-like protein